MTSSMELKQATYKGVRLEEVEQDLVKLERDIGWFGEHSNMEHLEARVETLRSRYKDILELEDDGTLPPVVTSLISALQQYEDMRR